PSLIQRRKTKRKARANPAARMMFAVPPGSVAPAKGALVPWLWPLGRFFAHFCSVDVACIPPLSKIGCFEPEICAVRQQHGNWGLVGVLGDRAVQNLPRRSKLNP